jgi:hypothetical protein
MAQTVIVRMRPLNRLHNSYDKTVNIAPLGRMSVRWNAALSPTSATLVLFGWPRIRSIAATAPLIPFDPRLGEYPSAKWRRPICPVLGSKISSFQVV